VLLPLDFYQKKVAYDNKKKTEAMEPYMEKLRKQYGGDKMAMSAKQRELQKKFKYNTFGPCLPAILSLVIFITLFGGFRKIADYEIYKAYADTKDVYVASYIATAEQNPAKFSAAKELYDETIAEIKKGDTEDIIFTPVISLDEGDFWAFVAANTVYEKDAENNPVYDKEGNPVIAGCGMGLDNTNINLVKVVTDENTGATPDTNKIYDVLLKTLAQRDAAVNYKADVRPAQKFLWIKNMWRPDAVWGMNGCGFATIEPVMPDSNLYINSLTAGCAGCNDYKSMSEYKKAVKDSIGIEYSIVMKQVITDNNKTSSGKTVYNGYYVLAVLIIGLSILSTKFNAAGNPAAAPQQATGGAEPGKPGASTMKMMMWIMPVMMGIFAISSNSAFSLYMVASTGTSLLSTMLCSWFIKLYDKTKTAKAGENKFQRYDKKPIVIKAENKKQETKPSEKKFKKYDKKK